MDRNPLSRKFLEEKLQNFLSILWLRHKAIAILQEQPLMQQILGLFIFRYKILADENQNLLKKKYIRVPVLTL